MNQERTSSGCPDESRWLALFAGSLDPSAGESDLSHAATCAVCATRLWQTAALLEEAASDAEEVTLNGLRSSKPEWQQSMAKQIAGTGPSTHAVAPRSRTWLPASLAAALLLAVGITLVLARRPTDERLLAEAYSQNGSTEPRLGTGRPGEPASAVRGSGTAESAELLELRLHAVEHLSRRPNDAQWHQLLGQVDLLEHDGEAARAQFQIVRVLDPAAADLPFHEGLAYFELAQTHEDLVFYARAAECFSEVLRTSGPRQAAAYYDRGLSYEKQNLYAMAVSDYEAALRLETDEAWRKEIEAHLQRVRLPQQTGALDQAPGLSSERLVAAGEKVDDLYERELDLALTGWLPDRKQEALSLLGQIGMHHGDAWLLDWLHSAKTKQRAIAGEHLAAAIVAAQAGKMDVSLIESRTALELYGALLNKPGMMRAKAAMVYGLQRTGRDRECLAGVTELLRQPAIERYSWLHTYLLLEGSACASSLGDQVASMHFNRQALALSERYDLPLQGLRARGFLAEDLLSAGQVRQAWAMDVAGLRECGLRSGTSMRRYQFLYNLGLGATQLRLPLMASALYDTAVEAANTTGNTQIAAYAFEDAGVSHLAAQQPDQAASAFAAATNLLASLPEGSAVTLYHADWEAERSAVLAARGDRAAALKRMSVAERSIAPTTTVYVKQPFFTRYAELLLDDRQPAAARHYAQLAVREAYAVLASKDARPSERAWSLDARPAYVALVESYLQAHDPEAALAAWESYRSTSATLIQSRSLARPWTSLPVVPRPPPGAMTLVFARLRSNYVAWAVPPAPLPVTVVQLSAEPGSIDQLVKTFVASCADPHSLPGGLELMGAALYQQLLAPLANKLSGARQLRLHLDQTLEQLPFDALVEPDHGLLLNRYCILHLSDGWPLFPPEEVTIASTQRALVIEGLPGEGPQYLAPAYDEGPAIAGMFPGAVLLSGPEATRGRIETDLPEAQIFHYAGHWGKFAPAEKLPLTGGLTLTPAFLSTEPLQRCRLAVLAACQTAEVDEDALPEDMSLAEAMLAGGAAQVVASGWEVDSSATRQLMLAFYGKLLQHQSTATALQAAKQLLRVSTITRHPYYWSAFQLFVR